MSTANSWKLPSWVTISEVATGNSEVIGRKILLLSESQETAFRTALEEKEVYDRPYPCALDSIDVVSNIDEFFRLVMFMPKYDQKRVKARLTIELQDALEKSIILDQKVRASELRREDYGDQIPRVTESVWGIFSRYCIHASSNLKTITNHFSSLLDEAIVFSPPVIMTPGDREARDIWEASCIEYVNKSGFDRLRYTIHVMQNSVEKFSVTLAFDTIKYNKVQVKSTCYLSPKTVYKCWDEAVRQFLIQGNISSEMKVSDLE